MIGREIDKYKEILLYSRDFMLKTVFIAFIGFNLFHLNEFLFTIFVIAILVRVSTLGWAVSLKRKLKKIYSFLVPSSATEENSKKS